MELGMWLTDLNWLVVVVGASLGSIKANFNDNQDQSACSRLVNVGLGVFCGIALAMHFEKLNTVWLNGLVATTTSMLAISILDTLYRITPSITRSLIKLYTTGSKK